MRLEPTDEGLGVEIASEDETVQFGHALARVASPGTVIGLVGPLGAGKTRLVKAFASVFGIDPDLVSSPTFVLIHEYEGRLPIYHFDAYRLGGPGPFESLGVSEYWDAGGICLVEWADLVAEVLPSGSWWLRIAPTGVATRRVLIDAPAQVRSLLAEALGGSFPSA